MLPYPHPPSATENANAASTAAVTVTGMRARLSFTLREIRKTNTAKAARRPPRSMPPGSRNPYRGTLLIVFMVIVVLAAPPVVASVAEPKVHVMPGTEEQDNVTLPLKPFDGVTVTITGADWPGDTDTPDGVAATAKSGVAVTSVIATGEVLPANVPAPAKDAVSE